MTSMVWPLFVIAAILVCRLAYKCHGEPFWPACFQRAAKAVIEIVVITLEMTVSVYCAAWEMRRAK